MLIVYSMRVVGGVTNESMVKLTVPEYYFVAIERTGGYGN